MIWVTDVRVLPEYRLWLRFSDGSNGDVDLKELVFSDTRTIVAALRHVETFAAVRVEMDTVVWSNGFDLAPEYLFSRLTKFAAA